MENTTREDRLIFDSSFLVKLEQLHLLSKKLFHGRYHAERRSKRTGSSLEFADYRNYTLGDDLRSVDWNIYGRLDRLFIKLFEEEQDLPIYFLIDTSASMHWVPKPEPGSAPRSTKFDQARRIAASLAYIALANLERVNIHYFASELGDHMGMSRGKGQFHKVLDFLKRVPAQNGSTCLLPSFRTFAQRVKQRGLVFVISDLFDAEGCEEALSLLRYNQFETSIVQVLDPAELQPALLGDLRLVESETGQQFEVTADQSLLKRYQREMQDFLKGVEEICRKRHINYSQATTAIPFDDLVLRLLREGRHVK
ncbi:MAG: DUF58 domain-containing protein [Chthoniobacteraceae bacterium]